MRRAFAAALAVAFAWPANAAWDDPKVWDDGRAEVAVYDAQRVVYGKARTFREQLITVKEDLRADILVKADNPSAQKTVRVFKLNQAQQFDTENYPYSYLTTVFAPAAAVGGVLKLTVGSQEWCGNTFKILTVPKEGKARLVWHSYFDGEADRAVNLDLKPQDLWDDGLPLALRSLPYARGYKTTARVWDSLTSSRGTMPQAVQASVSVTGEETLSTKAGTISCWIVAVAKPRGTDLYWIEKADPRILVKMEAADGRRRLLRGRARWAYWDRSLPRPAALN